MADMGFLPAVKHLLDRTPENRQTLLFSATLDGAVDALVAATSVTRCATCSRRPRPTSSRRRTSSGRSSATTRVGSTADVIKLAPARRSCSASTKHGTDGLAKKLDRLGVRTEAIHGNRSQGQRERALAVVHRRQGRRARRHRRRGAWHPRRRRRLRRSTSTRRTTRRTTRTAPVAPPVRAPRASSCRSCRATSARRWRSLPARAGPASGARPPRPHAAQRPPRRVARA